MPKTRASIASSVASDHADNGRDLISIIMNAAVDEMAEKGYAATSVRSIAARSDCSVAALYYHFESKHEILVRFMEDVLDRQLHALQLVVEPLEGRPNSALLEAIVRERIKFSTGTRSRRNNIANTELRSLEPEAYRRVVARRDAIQDIFDNVLTQGKKSGEFLTPIPLEVARAINVMTAGIATWYRSTGKYSVSVVSDHYVRMSLAMAEAKSVPKLS